MSKWKNLVPYNKVIRMVPIENKAELIRGLELAENVKSYRIRYRGPREPYQTDPFVAAATHFTIYIEMEKTNAA